MRRALGLMIVGAALFRLAHEYGPDKFAEAGLGFAATVLIMMCLCEDKKEE